MVMVWGILNCVIEAGVCACIYATSGDNGLIMYSPLQLVLLQNLFQSWKRGLRFNNVTDYSQRLLHISPYNHSSHISLWGCFGLWMILGHCSSHSNPCVSPYLSLYNQAAVSRKGNILIPFTVPPQKTSKVLVNCLLLGLTWQLYLHICVWVWCINTGPRGSSYSTASAVKQHLRRRWNKQHYHGHKHLEEDLRIAQLQSPFSISPFFPCSQYFLIISAAPQMCVSPSSPCCLSTLSILWMWMLNIRMRI